MKFICVVKDETIRSPCVLKSCMWHSVNSFGCIAHDGVPENEEITDEFVAEHKGITVKEVGILRKRGARTLERVLIVMKFLDWITSTLRSDEYPYVAGYHDPELQQAVVKFTANRWPYNVKELDWNIGKVYCSLSPKLWKAYAKTVHTEIEFNKAIGVDPTEAKEILTQYKRSAERANKEK